MTTDNSFSGLFMKLGSETFLDPKSLLIWLAPLMITLSLASSRAADLGETFVWFVANVIALLILAAVVLLFRFLTYRRNPELVINIFWVIGISALLGGAKTFATLASVSWMLGSILEPGQLMVKLFVGCLIGVSSLIASSLWGLVLKRLEYERQILLAAKSAQFPVALSNKERSSMVDLRAGLKELSQQLGLDKGSKHLSSFHAKLLRELVERNVRPLSTSLYSALEQKYPSVAPRALIGKALWTSPPATVVALFICWPLGTTPQASG